MRSLQNCGGGPSGSHDGVHADSGNNSSGSAKPTPKRTQNNLLNEFGPIRFDSGYWSRSAGRFRCIAFPVYERSGSGYGSESVSSRWAGRRKSEIMGNPRTDNLTAGNGGGYKTF